MLALASVEHALVATRLALDERQALPAPLLAFDTSTECLAIAACGPAGAFVLQAAGGAAASATLLPLALRVVAQAGLQLHELVAIAFGSGPGAFTGLRTTCAVAQGLGLGLQRPLLPLDSLLLVAEDARLQVLSGAEASGTAHESAVVDGGGCDIAVAMDARMNEVYAGRYRWQPPAPRSGPQPGSWQVLQAPQLCSLPALAQAWAGLPLPLVAGSALHAFGDRLPLPPQGRRIGTERSRAAALLHLALRAWAAGQAVDAAQALPLYVRDKVAQTTQERQLARSLEGTL